MKIKTINALLDEQMAIENESAQAAGKLGFMARAMVQASMPYREVEGNVYHRQAGNFRLSMASTSEQGLPFGTNARLLMAWISTEAVRTKSPELNLGKSLSSWMANMGLKVTGGRGGSIGRLKGQMDRLSSSMISCNYVDDSVSMRKNIMVIDESMTWWDAKAPEEDSLWDSTLRLNQNFFNEVTDSPVPIDLRTMSALAHSKSPMAMDIYAWLTYRMSYLRKDTTIPWELLEDQFGANYARTRDFKAAFSKQLGKTLAFYQDANVDSSKAGLVLRPSKRHIK